MKLATLMAREKAKWVSSCSERRKTPIDGVFEVEPLFPFKYLMNEDGGKLPDEINKEVVKTLLYGKGKNMKNDGLCQLVMNSLEFLDSLEERNARDIQWMINNNPFGLTEGFLAHLNTVKEDYATDSNTQEEILKKLQTEKIKVQKKLKFAKGCKKATSVAFIVVSAVVPIISLLKIAPYLLVPILQSILALAKPFSDFFWKRKEKALEGQKKVIKSMLLNNDVVMQDLGRLIDQVEEMLQPPLQTPDLAVTQLETVDERSVESQNAIGDLIKQCEKCCSNIENARKSVIESILKINASDEDS